MQTNKTKLHTFPNYSPKISGCQKQITGLLAKQMHPNSSRSRSQVQQLLSVFLCVVYTCVLPVHVHIEARGWHGCLLHHSPPGLFCLSLKQEFPGSTCVCPTVLRLQRLLYLVVT